MTKPRILWSGKYAGIAASVELVGTLLRPKLAGSSLIHREDYDGIIAVAVRELATERDTLKEQLSGMLNTRPDADG